MFKLLVSAHVLQRLSGEQLSRCFVLKWFRTKNRVRAWEPGIDYIVSQINSTIQFDFVCEYDQATNKLYFFQGSSILFIEHTRTCLDLHGLEANQVGFGVLEGKFGVDLTRTSSILLRTNLHGTNRDPVNKRTSDILCKVPVS